MPGTDTLPAAEQLNGELLRAIRLTLELTQEEFAALVRRAGEKLGDPNQCTKRLIQKWESGDHEDCRPNYRRALSKVTGMSYAQLCAPSTLLRQSSGVDVPGASVVVAVISRMIEQLHNVWAWLRT